jgi:hypothetical protein
MWHKGDRLCFLKQRGYMKFIKECKDEELEGFVRYYGLERRHYKKSHMIKS